MHVVVDDRDALEAELALRDARGDRDVVEEAEAHRAVAQRVMSRRSYECEAALQRRFDRRSGRERRCLERRLRPNGVGGEPREAVEPADARDVLCAVAEQQLIVGCRATLGPVREVLEQDGEPLLRFGVCARRVEVRERRVGQDVDRTVSSSSSSDTPPARASPTR